MPNLETSVHIKLAQIIRNFKSGKTRQGVQRFRCKTCGKYFVETSGMIFYRKRTAEHEILETLALLAEGNRISSLTRVKRHKEDTILLGEVTAYIERSNLTSRLFNGRQVRKTLAFSKDIDCYRAAATWKDMYYNLVKPHKSLRLRVVDVPSRKWNPRTPAMTAHLTDHVWSVKDLLTSLLLRG